MNSHTKLAIGMVGVCMICTTACRSSHWQSPNDVAALQAQRRAKVEKSVGLKQSEAELQLARDAWTFGDKSACLSALNGILEREPGHVEALLLKAEVHLAKDELIDADRSIAIALSHDPANTTAKRLSEIARTKQLAARPLPPAHALVDSTPAPLPAGAVAQAAYSPTEAGTALVEDERPEFPFAVPAQVSSPVDVNLPAPGEAFASAPGTSPAMDVQPDFPRVFESFPLAGNPLADAAPATPLAMDDPAGYAEVFDPLQSEPQPLQPSEANDLLASAGTASLTESQERQVSEPVAEAVQPVGEPAKPMPVILTPEEAAAYELPDDSAGMADVSDQAGWEDSQAAPSDFRSALASSDKIAALAAVEADITAHPDDPQIPISATVAALEANQPETAASIARLGIAFHPSCAGLHLNLGAALYRNGKYPSSQVALQQALSLDNTSALAYFLMGCVSEKLGDAEAAESHFRRAAELDPNLAHGE
jgi:Tfp pilus assembly protein PilF